MGYGTGKGFLSRCVRPLGQTSNTRCPSSSSSNKSGRLKEKTRYCSYYSDQYTLPIFNNANGQGIASNLNILTKCYSKEVQPVKLGKALIVSKLSRYEYEKKKHKNLSEKELENCLRKRGSNYDKLISFHYLHKQFEDQLKHILMAFGTEVEVVNRFSCTDEKVKNADIIFPIGGDGTFLLAASRVLNNKKPVIGFNSDPNRSEGYLCLPKLCSLNISKTIENLQKGKFQWLMRTRIRTTLAIDEKDCLHPQSLHHVDGYSLPPLKGNCDKNVLPVLALNEVFMGETLSARVSHLQMRLNDSEHSTGLKCSGICVSTGTGSTSWHLSINRLSTQSVAELLRLLCVNPNEGRENLASTLADVYNNNLIFKPDDKKVGYTIRDLISSSVWPDPKGIQPRGYASTVEIKSHCFDAYLVIDGGISFPFNDGAVAVLEILPEDALRTVENMIRCCSQHRTYDEVQYRIHFTDCLIHLRYTDEGTKEYISFMESLR